MPKLPFIQLKIKIKIAICFAGFLLMSLLFCKDLFLGAIKTLADSFTWGFTTSGDYTYDSSKISVTGGSAQLSTSSDWYDTDWLYRKGITIDNTASSSALSNYQIAIDLDSNNFDFSKAMVNGEDIRVTDSDGATSIPYFLEHFNNMNLVTQDIEDYSSLNGADAWWHFSADANDSSGNSNNGTLAGNAAIVGSSLKLDGNGDYVSVADNSNLDFNSSFTIELWARSDSLPASGTTRQFIAKGGTGDATGNDHNYYFGIGNSDAGYGLGSGPGLTFGFEDSAGANYQVTEYVQLNTGQWYHLTGVFDDTANTLSIYVNGVLANVLTNVAATPFTQNSSLLIGAKIVGSEYFDGRIREVRLIDSVLSASQILSDYKTTLNKGKIWAKVPSIPANSTKTIYVYYGLASTTSLELGLISDIHGFTDNSDKKGTQATAYLGDFIDRMNNSFTPDATVDLGDKIITVDHDTDLTDLGTVAGLFSTLTSNLYYTLGNHEIASVTKAEVKTALGIDYTHKSVDVGNYHIIILDSQDTEEADPWGGALTDAEKAWLTNELSATNKKTLVFSHQPLDTQNMALNQYFSTSNDVFLANAADVRSILENDGDVIGVFSGHLHWNNKTIVNNIPYFSIGSLVEDYGKNWAEVSIVGDQFLNVVYKQNGDTEKIAIWDFINNEEYNNPQETFNFYDGFDGDSGQWAELTGLTGGNWSISGKGYLQETGTTTGQHKILNSNYTEPSSYIVEANIGLYGANSGRTQLGGFASRVTNSTNFDAIYMANDADDDIRWKQMDGGAWELIGQQTTFSPDTYWHLLRMVKLGNQRIVYLDGVQQLDLTNGDLAEGTFGLWTYFDSIQYDNLKILPYVTIPTNTVGNEVTKYPNDNPTIESSVATAFSSISAFSEVATKADGEIKYQISNDGGLTWYWYNSGWSATTSTYAEANTATSVNSNISSFPVGDGQFMFKAYLNSDGTDLVSLDSIDLTYVFDNTVPTGGSLSYSDGYTITASVPITVSDGTDDSGINTSSRILQRSAATLSGGDCDSYGSFLTVVPDGSYPNFIDTSVTSGFCYKYKYLVSDNYDNQATYASSNVVKVDTEAPGAPGVPTTTTPTSSTSQSWTWSNAVDLVSGIASYAWRITGDSILSGSTILATLTTNLVDGVYNFFVKAIDNAGNAGSEVSSILTVDTVAPTVSLVSSGTPSSDSVTISWSTSEDASSLVEYGLSNTYGTSSVETDTTTRVREHVVNLSNLLSCTTYHYRVKSKDALNQEGVGSDASFTTSGCMASSDIVSQSSVSSAPICSDGVPGSRTPWIFKAIPQNSSEILIYFMEADGPVDRYILEYGSASGNYQYGSQNLGINTHGQMSYLVKSLLPNTTYYFRIKAGNGCAAGGWSNEISSKTFSLLKTNKMDINNSSLEPILEEHASSSGATKNYSINLKVQDESGNPIEGVEVTIHSDVRTAKTNSEGIVSFENIEGGNHEITLSYAGYEGRENINLAEDLNVKEYNLNVTIQKNKIIFPPLSVVVISVLLVIILILVIRLFNLKKKDRN